MYEPLTAWVNRVKPQREKTETEETELHYNFLRGKKRSSLEMRGQGGRGG